MQYPVRIPSEPGALVVSVFISTCSTSVMLIIYLFGTSRSVVAGGAGSGSKCKDTEWKNAFMLLHSLDISPPVVLLASECIATKVSLVNPCGLD